MRRAFPIAEQIPEYPDEKIPGDDPVNHPKHYISHPSGVECIEIVEHLGFCVGNAIKYLWRAGLKTSRLEDLKKGAWYIQREIERLEALEAKRLK